MPPTTNLPADTHRTVTPALDSSLSLEPSDGELMMRFIRHGDQTAFAELVAKHANLVWNVCWQILRRHHDVEDSFQATFLILSRRAKTVRSCESLASWLYRVAYRTALKSRLQASSRLTAEISEEYPVEGLSSLERIQQDEHRCVLLEELQSLPLQYQEPLVLCYLAGNSRCQVAEELSLTTQTVKGRLARGKQMLRQRLIRRGVSLSIAMGLIQVAARSAQAALAPQAVTGLASSLTLKTCPPQGSEISSQALHLAEQGIRTMQLISATKYSLITVFLISTATVGLSLTAVGDGGQAPEDAVPGIALAAANAESLEQNADRQRVDVQEVQVIAEANGKGSPPARVLIGNSADQASGVTIVTTPGASPDVLRPVAPIHQAITLPPNITAPVPPNVAVQVKQVSPELIQVQTELAKKQADVVELQIRAKQAEIRALAENSEKQRAELERHAKIMLAEAELALLEARRIEQKAQVEEIQVHTKVLPKVNVELELQLKALSTELAEVKAREQTLKAELDAVRQQLEKSLPKTQSDPAHMPEPETTVPSQPVPTTTATPTANYSTSWPASNVVSNTYSYAPTASPPRTDLEIGDVIQIEVAGAFPDKPIEGQYRIEPMGTVALGATYGRVKVAGMSILDAERELKKHLSQILSDVEVQITLAEPLR